MQIKSHLHSPWRPGDEVFYVSVLVKPPRLDWAGPEYKLSALSEDQVKWCGGGWGLPIAGWAKSWQPVLDARHNTDVEEVRSGGRYTGLCLVTAAPECLSAIFSDIELKRRRRSWLPPLTGAAWRAGRGAGGIFEMRVDVTG